MPDPGWSQHGLHVLAKPIGPLCNLACSYCFYLQKESLYPGNRQWRMTDETLAAYVRQYVEAQPEGVDEIDFAFQGGEPTMLGLDFFRRAVDLQQQHVRPGMRVHNSLQTNGVLLDDDWCEFLRRHNFLVGLSIDGPADLHDRHRVDRKGQGTHGRVMAAMERLRRHGVEFNALTCVNRHNGDHPQRVYRFLRDCGVEFMQFIPIVERREGVRPYDVPGQGKGVRHLLPERPGGCFAQKVPDPFSPAFSPAEPDALVSPRSVRPRQFGRFLVGVFDEWLYHDVGRVFVRDFDQALGAWVGAGATLCVYTPECGRAVAIEHNGDLYRCDHFVDPEHRLGNIHQASIRELVNHATQEQFGRDKSARLPAYCRECPYLLACHGACPKDRILAAPGGEPGLNYLCEGFRAFFAHVEPTMQAMAAELAAGRPAAGVMQRVRAQRERARQEAAASGRPIGRNDPCPCGSGRKYKSCCLRR